MLGERLITSRRNHSMITKKQIYDALTKGQNLIRDPANWLQGRYAQNQNNWDVPQLDTDACKFCSLGALDNATGQHSDLYWSAKEYLTRAVGNTMVVMFNDAAGRTHPEIMTMWDTARDMVHQEIIA